MEAMRLQRTEIPINLNIAKKLAINLGADLIVVDAFIKDYTIGADSTNYWFNEFNIAPALRLYCASLNSDGLVVPSRLVDKFIKGIKRG